MGKALIVLDLGAGEYTVELQLDADRAMQLITELQAKSGEKQTAIGAQQVILDNAKTVLDDALGNVNVIIAQVQQGTKPFSALVNANNKLISFRRKVLEEDRKIRNLKLEKTSIDKRREFITNNIPVNPELQVWCADFTEGLTGEVATIEVAGEKNQVNVRPGFFDDAVFAPTRDGQLQPVVSSGPTAVYYNWALRPGWQKWKPNYRTGLVSNLVGDTCDVLLDVEISDDQALEINQTASLFGVPIVYMECNGAAFENGDSCLVEFLNNDWETPQVIGFKDNPKLCVIDFNLKSTLTAEEGILTKTGMPWRYTQRPVQFLGTVNWHDTVKNISVSWRLSNSPETSFRYHAAGANASIYFRNQVFLAPHPVWGACITTFASVDHLIAITKSAVNLWEVWKLSLADLPSGFVLVQDITAGIGIYNPRQSFFFNDSGTNATCVGKYLRSVTHSTGPATIDDIRVMDLAITATTAVITLHAEQALSDRTVDHIATYTDIMFFSFWFGKNTHYDFEVLENSERTMFTDYDGSTLIPINLKYDESYILDEQIDTDDSANPDDVLQTLATTTTISLLVNGIEKIKPYELTQTYSTTWTFNEIMGENVDYVSLASDTVTSRTMLAFDARDSSLGYYLELQEIRVVNVADATPEDGFLLDETGSTTRRKKLISFNGLTLDSMEQITPFSGTRDFAKQKNAAGLAASTFIPGALPDARSHAFVDDTFQSTGITDMDGAFNRIDKWAWMPESLLSGLAIGTVGSVGSFLSSLPEDHFVPGPDPDGTATWIFNRYLFGDNYGAINRVGDICQIIEGMDFAADFSNDHDVQFTGTFHKELTGGDIDLEVGNSDIDQVFFG